MREVVDLNLKSMQINEAVALKNLLTKENFDDQGCNCWICFFLFS